MNKERHCYFFLKILQYLFIILCILSLYGWYRLELNTDILKLLPDTPSLKNLQKYNRVFSSFNRILITIVHKEKKEQELLDAANRTVEILKTNLYFESVQAKLDILSGAEVKKFYEEQIPNLLEATDFEKISQKITTENIHSRLSAIWEQQIGIAPSSSNIRLDPLQFSEFFWKKLSWDIEIYQGYLLSKDHKALLIQIPYFSKQLSHAENIHCWEFLKEARQKIRLEFPGMDMISIGGQRIATENQRMIIADVKLISILTISALCFLFLITLKNFFFFLLFFFPSLFGMFVGVGICNLFSSQLSLLTLGYGSIVIGISIDYGIHYLTHIEAMPSVTPFMVIRNIFKPLSFAMISTCVAMIILSFSSFPAYIELGWFIASGVFGSFLFVVVLYPKIAEFIKKKKTRSIFRDFSGIIKKLGQQKFKKILKASAVVFIMILAGISAQKIASIGFVTDFEQFSYRSEETREDEEKFFSIWGDQRGKIAIVVQGKTFEEALEKNDIIYLILQKAEKQNELKIVNFSSRLLPSLKRMKASHEIWKSYWTKERLEKVRSIFQNSTYGFSSRAFDPFFKQIENPSPPQSIAELSKNASFSSLLQDSVILKDGVWYVQTIIQIKDFSTAAFLYEAMEKSVSDVILVDRIKILKTTDTLLREEIFWIVLAISLFLILLLKLFFVYLETILCNFIPLFLSILCTLGILVLLGVPVDLFNILVIIFILSIGIDYTVFHSCSYLSTGGLQGSTSTSNFSIILCASTTILGFGALVFAKHPALHSLGLCSIIGISMALINSLYITPIFLHFFMPPNRKSHPIHIYHFIPTFWSGICYFVGFISLATIVFPSIALWQKITGKNNKTVYLRIIEYLNKRVLDTDPLGNVVHRNFPPREKLDGCVVVSNHVNMSDIPLFNSLPCDKITLVKWFWKIPFVGAVLRMAGFIPIPDKLEISYNNQHIEISKKILSQKINVFFFPEGTRVQSFKMQRFHQGAFLLACSDKIPVLPVCFFNSRWVFPKGRFIVRDFELIASALPFITPDNFDYSSGPRALADHTKKLIEEEYERIADEKACECRQARLVRDCYIYIAPYFSMYLFFKLYMDKSYRLLPKLLPREGNILDIGCGAGFLSNLLVYSGEKRHVLGIDYDEEKISLARKSIISYLDQSLEFIAGDILEETGKKIPLEYFNGVLCCDLLHYFPLEKQKELILSAWKTMKPGASLVIRQDVIDSKTSFCPHFLYETFGKRVGFNSFFYGEPVYPSAEQILSWLEETGFIRIRSSLYSMPKNNQIILIAEKPIL